jgi:glycerol-3-phosphate acyltransferase PlsX
LPRDLVISIDAMGGDNAPQAIVEGAALSLVRYPKVRFLLHGDHAKLQPLMVVHQALAKASEIKHCDDAIGMDEKPGQALRRGRNSSMWRAIESVKAGEAQSVVSAGNTGALMAMAKFQLRSIEGLSRPAIAATWPTIRGQSVVLDVGANIDQDARQLVDFAILGEAYAKAVFGLDKPLVGILNVGAEDMKGHEEVKLAAQMLKDTGLPIRFHGFIEGHDISSGTVDVVVTDGFTGNIALKTAEGTARLIGHYIRGAMQRSLFSKIGYLFSRGAFDVLRQKMDPRAVNGGVFLGLNGIVVKSHGGTDALGFATALDIAIDMARNDLTAQIASVLAKMPRSMAAAAEPAPGQDAAQ